MQKGTLSKSTLLGHIRESFLFVVLITLPIGLAGCFGGGPSEADITQYYEKLEESLAESLNWGGRRYDQKRIEIDLHGCSAVDHDGYSCRYRLVAKNARTGLVDKEEEIERVWVQVYGKWKPTAN